MACGSGAGQAYAAIPPGQAPGRAHVSLVAHLTSPRHASPCPALILSCLSCPHLSSWPPLPSVVSGRAMPWRLVASCRMHESEEELQEESKKGKKEEM